MNLGRDARERGLGVEREGGEHAHKHPVEVDVREEGEGEAGVVNPERVREGGT